MKKFFNAFLCVLLLFVATSCRHKELCYDHGHVVELRVVFDWKHAPEARPQSMAVFFYPEEPVSEPYIRYDFIGRDGGVIRLPMGRYKALCINSDTQNVDFVNDQDYYHFEATTYNGNILSELAIYGPFAKSNRAAGTEDERVALSPEALYTDHTESINLLYGLNDQIVTFAPKLATPRYTVEIRNAQNLKYILGMSGSLASMAGGWLPALEEAGAQYVTIPFDTRYSPETQEVHAQFLTFGTAPARPLNVLTIYVVHIDGSKWYYPFDVTDQIYAAPDPFDVHIVLDGLPIPKPIVNGGGLHPQVDAWEEVEISIDMQNL